ncbi:MAG TPA: TonB-dependent receptor [Hyphomonadaceae bacterium]|nr:TonB-dependent receptor [Hyphomonadaceae bacterium]
MSGYKFRSLLGASISGIALSLVLAGAAQAQTASSGVRGEAAPNARVVARNVDSGFTTSDTADADGDFALLGLQPGTYEITVTANGETTTRRVRVLVGQTARLDLLGVEEDEIVVTARRLDDPTTSEVGTNVTREQIEGLPQTTRNFVNFAALAPGVRTSQEATGEVTFSGGGQNPLSANVFIDGQSQKAQIIDGGVSGQDDSRGNPFPQLGVQEFRVLTQNFSAQYDQSSSTIITSVTRSGTNEFEIEGFATYQPSDAVSFHHLGGNTSPDPETERRQYGFAIGGPIVTDRLHFFGTYEGRQDDKFSSVFLGRTGYAARFGQFEGTVATPFEEDIFFGKLSWQPAPNQHVDFSASYRDERDIRDVGGQDAAERANVLDITETKYNLRHDWQGDNWSNLAQLDFLESTYNPTAQNFSDIGEAHIVYRDNDGTTPGFQFNVFNEDTTIIRLGGRDSNQDITQRTTTLRDDFTLPEIQWNGEHQIQIGGRIAFNNYNVSKEFNRNPFFFYDVDGRPEINGSNAIPVRVVIGSPVPAVDVDNTVYGFYVQDNWGVTDRLEVNLGLRWDYEDNAYNNDYTTPARIVGLLNAYRTLPGYTVPFNTADYISDGSREAFTGAWQPRLGFSYDLSSAGDESTVIFGGAGRYYDRIPYNFAFDERFKPTQVRHEFFFSADGLRPGTIMFNPAFLTPAGLQPLINANPGAGEVFLIKNGAEPPVTDQFNIGIRQRLGDWRLSATLSHAESRNGFQWHIGNLGVDPLNPNSGTVRFGGPTPSSLGFPEFRNLIFISEHDQEREFDALYLTADKAYTEESGWSLSVSYTLSHATQNGSRDTNTAPFDFDYARTDMTPTFDAANDERHRLVTSGLVDLPWNTRLSGIYTYGSGTPFHIFGPNPPGWNEGRRDPFHQVDLRFSKYFDFEEEHRVELFLDVINATDRVNNPNIEQCTCGPFGQPFNQVVQGRSFQIGARARW